MLSPSVQGPSGNASCPDLEGEGLEAKHVNVSKVGVGQSLYRVEIGCRAVVINLVERAGIRYISTGLDPNLLSEVTTGCI